MGSFAGYHGTLTFRADADIGAEVSQLTEALKGTDVDYTLSQGGSDRTLSIFGGGYMSASHSEEIDAALLAFGPHLSKSAVIVTEWEAQKDKLVVAVDKKARLDARSKDALLEIAEKLPVLNEKCTRVLIAMCEARMQKGCKLAKID